MILNLRILLLIVFCLLMHGSYSVSQNSAQTDGKFINSELNRSTFKSVKQIKIEEELLRLKKEDNSLNINRIIELNLELEKITGYCSGIKAENMLNQNGNSSISFTGKNTQSIYGNDFISNTRIYNNDNRKVKAIAGAIEQRGATAGKIWAVVIYSADTLSPDSLRVYYSVTGGSTWQLFVPGNIRPYDKLNYDDLDMELIENTSGQKYLWVTFGYRQTGESNGWSVGAFVLQVPSLNGTFYNLISWPGSDSVKRYYNIKITSDNAEYSSTPYLYLACSFDSLNSSGVRVNSQKFARILNPFSLNNPVFSFLGPSFYWYDSSGPENFTRNLYTDIAYFKNGGKDSVIVSYCGVPDSTKLFFAKCDINGNPPVTSQGAGGPVGGNNPGEYKTHARLSSNGNDNGSIVCVFNQNISGNRNITWLNTINYGNFESGISQSPPLGSLFNTNYHPEITGVRGGSTHYISFLTKGLTDSIHYLSMNSTGTINHVLKVNYFSSASEIAPKPLFRYITSDSCLALYSEDGPYNLVSASGCSGEPIGLLNAQRPEKFTLDQNYPNPFNPVTKITYSITEKSIVTLIVYDLLGKEIIHLVNGKKEPGRYEVVFDAASYASGVYLYELASGNYRDYKKMVLLK